MAYKYHVNKRNPIASFILDDDSHLSYFDNTGFGAVAKTDNGSEVIKGLPVVAYAKHSMIHNVNYISRFEIELFRKGEEDRPFVLEAWVYPFVSSGEATPGEIEILSHIGSGDGLTVEGTVVKFSTKYENYGVAECTYDLQTQRAAHIVGIHNREQNQLWVDGELKSYVDITDEQRGDTYIDTYDDFLYCGNSEINEYSSLAVNGIAFYHGITGEQIKQNYLMGRDVLSQSMVIPQYDGVTFSMAGVSGSIFIDKNWTGISDFNAGLKDNVEYSSERIEPTYIEGISVPGSWTVGVPLDLAFDASIYGVSVEWRGQDVTIDAMIGEETQYNVPSGTMIDIIPDGMDPTGIVLSLRVNFNGGLEEDPAYLDFLRIVGFRDKTFQNNASRDITVTTPAVLRQDYEPFLYRDDNGVYLNGATLVIGEDTSEDPPASKTLELWIRSISGSPSISLTGATNITYYYNAGLTDDYIPGAWNLIHITSDTDITEIEIEGDCIVGQATLYPSTLSADDVSFIYESYTGRSVIGISDSATITVSEPDSPVSLYDHDWAITSAG